MEETPFVGEPEDSREAIMRATFVALQEHGYAGLSIQRIADQASLSKSTFYHHFDDKRDLLASFVEFLLREFVTVLAVETGPDPKENLETFLEILVADDPDIGRDLPDGIETVLGSYVELRSQAVRDEQFRRKFTQTDRTVNDHLAGIIRAGIEADQFADVDPEETASMLLTILAGHMFRRTTRDTDPTPKLRPALDEYLQSHLYR